jgi:putative flippase GtrA
MDLAYEAVVDRFRGKMLKYCSVSAVGVATSTLLLLVCLDVLHWTALISNLVAVSLSSIPAYLLNRAWVWGKTSKHSLTREVLPFWGMAVIGLAWSSVVVWAAARWTDVSLLLVAANIAAFGSLWLAKFLVLDEVLFRAHHAEHVEHVEHPDDPHGDAAVGSAL